MKNVILTLNAGSSNIKFALFDTTLHRLVQGRVEHSQSVPHLVVYDTSGAMLADSDLCGSGHEDILEELLTWIDRHLGSHKLAAVGHRIVHGGQDFAAPVQLTASVREALARLSPLAPLHQPHNLAAATAMEKLRPGLLQVGCFDTAFHSGIDATRRRFGLPRDLENRGIRRYGFHGLSYQFVAERLAEIAPARSQGRIVMAHLGGGSSLCAMDRGRSVDTSMGLTPLDGLVMGTRCGALDPGVILYLLLEEGMRADQVEDLLYRRSGLLGVSGISGDLRELLASKEAKASEAIDLYVLQVVRGIGAMAASLGGLDGLVFTGGIGQNSPLIRKWVVESLYWMGFSLDESANHAGATLITAPGSRMGAWVIPTDEEFVVARHTSSILNCARSTPLLSPSRMMVV